jgi:uncharacterized membrane protein YidH (DUF202 family)
MAKILGYIIAAIGIIGLAASQFQNLKYSIENTLNFQIPLDNNTLLITSIIIIVIGLFFLKNKKLGKNSIPIFRGKRIIGYR